MPSATDLSPDTRLFALFIGESGGGKTVAACSFPQPIDVIDFDGRIRGILGAKWIDRSKIRYEYYPPRQPGLIEMLDKKLELYNTMHRMGQELPKTIVLDSLTNQCFALLQQSIPLTHSIKDNKQMGKKLGTLNMAGPEDYGFEATATYNIIAFLKSIPIPNVIVTAHVIQRYGKLDQSNLYSESVPIGEKLSVRDKIAENVQTHFDHVFRFGRRESAGRIEYWVKFWSDIARTSYPNLPTGEVDITGVSFYDKMLELVNKGVKQ